MLIQRLNCPFGCINANMTESIKNINSVNSNLLLDSKQGFGQQTATVVVYTCQCCGKSFETPSSTMSEGKIIL